MNGITINLHKIMQFQSQIDETSTKSLMVILTKE